MSKVLTETRNLDRLVKAGIVPQTKAKVLQQSRNSDKLAKIEGLTSRQIDAIVKIHRKIGRIDGCFFI